MASSLFLNSSLFFLSFLFTIIFVNSDCSMSKCTNHPYSYRRDSPIPFPFSTPDQPRSCGLPGFELGCNVSNKTPLLSFPSGDVYTVEYIYNISREIKLTSVCLPEKLMRLNYSGTPFYSTRFNRFAFFTCPSSFSLIGMCEEVKCIGTIVCEVSVDHSNFLDSGCNFLGNIIVSGLWKSPSEFSNSNSTYLNWKEPDECKQCDSREEVCGRDPYNYTNIKCFPRPKDKVFSTKKLIFIILPIIALIITCVSYTCRIKLRRQNRNTSGVVGNTITLQTYANQESNVTSGLEQATLDTFPILHVGDSGRVLINMEDKKCAICLSDYEPKDVIKTLPGCLHRFHSDCIDEWLLTKAVCPICRTTPPQTSS